MLTQLDSCLAALSGGDDALANAAVADIALLAAEHGDAVLAALGQLLQSPQTDTRWWASRTLAAIVHPQIPILLSKSLGDKSAAVRQCAALGLRMHPDVQALPALVAALEDTDHLVRQMAADALVAIGEPAVLSVRRVFHESNPNARLQAVRALALIGDTSAIPELMAALDQDSALLDYWANEGLERMGVGMTYFFPE